MWSDSNDKIMELFRDRAERFPRTCPCCGAKAGHMFLTAYESSEIGGGWAWCSKCQAYCHASYRIPAWWKNMPSIPLEELFSCPDNLDEMNQSIDEWVNSLLNVRDTQKKGATAPTSRANPDRNDYSLCRNRYFCTWHESYDR